MDEPGMAAKLVRALRSSFPDGSPNLRPVHAFGISATGYFEASDIALDYTVAEHFQGQRVPAIVRFSNGSGSAVQHDGWSDVRGMATRFYLANRAATDLIAMTLNEFFTRTPEQTYDSVPGALKFADAHRYAKLPVFQAASLGAPASYARATYHAVHTFVALAPDGVRRSVRFTWQPVSGVLPDPSATPADKYLQQELRDRLAEGPARFILMMTIGEAGDDFDDPSRPWSPHRIRLAMGTLTLDAVPDDQVANCELLSFNPWRLAPGIEASDDPVLGARRDAYELSRAQRGAPACPFSGG
jgi:catalase